MYEVHITIRVKRQYWVSKAGYIIKKAVSFQHMWLVVNHS